MLLRLTLIVSVLIVFGIPPALGQLEFLGPTPWAAAPDAANLALVDLDGDGDLDVVTANDSHGHFAVCLGNGDGTFAPPVLYPAGTTQVGVVATDLDGSGTPDIAILLRGVDDVAVYLNQGGGVLMAPTFHNLSLFGIVQRLRAADVDDDGDTDLLVTRSGIPEISLLTNDGAAGFTLSQIQGIINNQAIDLDSGDVDGDGDTDLVVAQGGSFGEAGILLNQGGGSFVAGPIYTFNFTARAIDVADYDGDSDLDIAMGIHDYSLSPKQVVILLNDGAGSFSLLATHVVSTTGTIRSTDSSDLDADGDLDLVLTTKLGNQCRLMIGNGDGTFPPGPLFTAPGIYDYPSGAACGDLDGDGRNDVVIALENSPTFATLLNRSPQLVLGAPPVVGTVVPLQLMSPLHPLGRYLCLLSEGSTPGTVLSEGRILPINPGLLLRLTLDPANPIFPGNRGLLDASGSHTVPLFVPPTPAIVGLSIYGGLLILNPGAPSGIWSFSPALTITFQ